MENELLIFGLYKTDSVIYEVEGKKLKNFR